MSELAEPSAAPDCLQRALLRRSRFRQQVSADVGPLRPRNQAAHDDARPTPTGEATRMTCSVRAMPERTEKADGD